VALKSKAVRGVAWVAAQRAGTRILSFLVFVILSRLLAPQAFGLVAMATVFTALVDILLDQGFTQALVQRARVSRQHFDTAFWTGMMLGSALTLAGVAGAEWIALAFRDARLAPVVRWLSLSLLLSALSKTQQAILQRELKFGLLAGRTMGAEVTGAVVGISMAYGGFGVWSLVGRNLARDFVATLILWSVSGWRPGLRFSVSCFRQLFPFGVSIVGNRLVEFLGRNADRFLIGSLLGATALGYYTVGYRFVELVINLFLGSIRTVSFPVLSRLQDKNEHERMRRFLYQATWYANLLAFPTFVGIALIAPEAVLVLFGSKWAPSAPVMRVLALVGIPQLVAFLGSSLLLARGKASWAFSLTAVNALANALAFVVVVRWGIVAVSAAFVVRAYLLLPLMLMAMVKVLDVDLGNYLRQFIPAAGASATMVAAVLIFKAVGVNTLPTAVSLALYVACAAVTYGLTLRMMQPGALGQVLEAARLLIPREKPGKG